MRGQAIKLGVAGILMGLSLGGRADASELESARQKAPQGVSLTGIFETGTTPNNGGTLIQGTNPHTPGTDILKVATGVDAYGSLWSTPAYHFRLDRSARASMWLYFGHRQRPSDALGEGLALVLQNDPRGNAAIPTGKLFGETLGVWGSDDNATLTRPDGIARKAIQNSWALEFDTHTNVTRAPGAGSAFDVGHRQLGHIAANYPGEPASYQRESRLSGLRWRYFYQLVHQAVTEVPGDLLADGDWHHVTFDWDAPQRTMTYTYNDRDPLTSTAEGQPAPGPRLVPQRRTIKLDVNKLHLSPDQQTIRWGFTGMTSAAAANQLVIFEEVPGVVAATVTPHLWNATTDQALTSGGVVHANDTVQLTYDLAYQGGQHPWEGILAQLRVPRGLTYRHGTVTYADGRQESLDLDALNQDARLEHRLATLSSRVPTAKIHLTGTAQNPADKVQVTAQTSHFQSPRHLVTASHPNFWIYPRRDLKLRPDQARVTVAPGKAAVITGTVTPALPGLRLRPRLNGRALSAVTVPATGHFEVTLAARDLKRGANELDLQVVDEVDNQSHSERVTVMVTTEKLVFETVGHTGRFRPTVLTGSEQIAWHHQGWQLTVRDTRGTTSPWRVQVAATPFMTAQGESLMGQLIYRKDRTTVPVTDQATTVHVGQAGKNRLTNVVADWTATSGLGVHLLPGALPGDYYSTLTWTLTDAPG